MHHLSIVHCPSPAHQDIPEATDKGRQGRQGRQGSKDGPEDVVRGPGSSGDSFGAQRFLAFLSISRLSWDITWDIYWDLHSYSSYSSYGNVARSEIIEVIVGLSIAIYLMTRLQEGHPEPVIISDPMAKGWSHVELWLSPRSSKMQETYIFFYKLSKHGQEFK